MYLGPCVSGFFFFFSSRRRHTRCLSDWSSDVCSSDLEDLADRDADVLDRVMPVDLQVAGRQHLQVEAAVPGQLVEHVIEEREAGADLRGAGAVDNEVDDDRRLLRLALLGCHPRRTHVRTSSSAANSASSSSGVPIVM